MILIDLPKQARDWPLPNKSVFLQENDAKMLLWLASITTGSIVEIGCNVGATTKQLAHSFPNRMVFGVDWTGDSTMHQGQSTEQPSKLRIGMQSVGIQNVTIVDCDSRKLDYSTFGSIGLIFIDGDHTYEGVKADTELALAVKPRPIIAYHDVSEGHPDWVGVLRYLTEISSQYAIVRVKDTWVAYLS